MGDFANQRAVERFAEAFGDEIAAAYPLPEATASVRYYDHTGMAHVFVEVRGVTLVDPDPVFDPNADTTLNASRLSGFVGDGLTNLERRLSDVMEEGVEVDDEEIEITCPECDGSRVSTDEGWCGTCGGDGTVPKNEI